MRYRAVDQIILSYHAVSSNWSSPLAVSEETLAEQLSLLCKRGYEGLTFAEQERRRRTRDLPEKSVAVTFDDGYASTLKAIPILSGLGLPGTVFPVTSFVESGESLCWPGISHWVGGAHQAELRPLTWDQLADLASAGWEVGSHTVNHPDLLRVDDVTLKAELYDSHQTIAARLGDCHTIAYPYGHANCRIAAVAAEAGYAAGCTLSRFHLDDEPYLRPRIALFEEDTGMRLHLKLSRLASTVRRSQALAGFSKADGTSPVPG